MRALDCLSCRAAWQAVRSTDLIAGKPPAERRALLDAYLGEYHRNDHDGERTRAAFEAQERAEQRRDPRPLPPMVALDFGWAVQNHPGFYAFCTEAGDEGFALSHPSDWDLTDDEWAETAALRVRVLVDAFARTGAEA